MHLAGCWLPMEISDNSIHASEQAIYVPVSKTPTYDVDSLPWLLPAKNWQTCMYKLLECWQAQRTSNRRTSARRVGTNGLAVWKTSDMAMALYDCPPLASISARPRSDIAAARAALSVPRITLTLAAAFSKTTPP